MLILFSCFFIRHLLTSIYLSHSNNIVIIVKKREQKQMKSKETKEKTRIWFILWYSFIKRWVLFVVFWDTHKLNYCVAIFEMNLFWILKMFKIFFEVQKIFFGFEVFVFRFAENDSTLNGFLLLYFVWFPYAMPNKCGEKLRPVDLGAIQKLRNAKFSILTFLVPFLTKIIRFFALERIFSWNL